MFGTKKEENKETEAKIPENNLRVRESSGGKYALNAKDELIFRKVSEKKVFDPILRQWIKQKPVTQEIPISDMHWHKEILDNIVVLKKIPSRTTIDGIETLFFLQEIVYRVRHELTYCYLHRESRSHKIFLKDFDTSICYQAPHTTNQYVIFETVNTKPVDKATVIKMYQEGKISDVYADVIDINGEKVYKKQVYVK